MLYLPLTDLFVNPGALLLIGICLGILTAVRNWCGNLLLVPALNLFGLPAVLAVSAGTGGDFAQSVTVMLDPGEGKHFPHRTAFSLIACGMAGSAAGSLGILLLSGDGPAATLLRTAYTSLLAAGAAVLLLSRLRRRGWPGTLLPRLFSPPSRFFLPPGPHSTAAIGLLTGFLNGFLGLGAALTGKTLLERFGPAPAGITGRLTRLNAVFTAGTALFIMAAAGRVEILALLLLLTGIFIGRSTGAILPPALSRSLPVQCALAALMLLTAAALCLKTAGAAETAGLLGLTGLLASCSLLLLSALGYGLLRRFLLKRTKAAPVPQHH